MSFYDVSVVQLRRFRFRKTSKLWNSLLAMGLDWTCQRLLGDSHYTHTYDHIPNYEHVRDVDLWHINIVSNGGLQKWTFFISGSWTFLFPFYFRKIGTTVSGLPFTHLFAFFSWYISVLMGEERQAEWGEVKTGRQIVKPKMQPNHFGETERERVSEGESERRDPYWF